MTWPDDAACKGADPDLFFSEDIDTQREAKAICADCPVKEPCGNYALMNGENYGTWGGMTMKELRRRRRFLTIRCVMCGTVFRWEIRFGRPPTVCGDTCRRAAAYKRSQAHKKKMRA